MLQTSASFRSDAQDLNGSISLSEIISALSYALDLTEGAVQGHALRSCLLGMRIAAEAKLSAEQTGSLYFALLLKDVGCSSNASRMCQIVGGDDRTMKAGVKFKDWAKPHKPSLEGLKLLWRTVLPEAGPGAKAARILRIGLNQHTNKEEMIGLRCGRGERILRKLGMGDAAAEAVRCVDEHWDGHGLPDGLRGEEIPILSRICAVAQHLDVFSVGRSPERAIEAMMKRSGSWFDPELVGIASSLHRAGRLWGRCQASDPEEETRQAVLDLDGQQQHHLGPGQIDQICEAFADVVDAKSHFTYRHSMGVANAALGIARHMGLSADRIQLVRRAALLHDVGKLSVSNSILDKTAALDSKEWRAVYQHPSVTRLILEKVAPFGEIAVVAGEHHEKLNGSGYPHRLEAKDLSLESRIISVADVYGALSEDRPYRPGLMLDEIISIMQGLVPHQLDAECFDALMSVTFSNRDMSYAYGPHLSGSPMVYAM